MLTLHASKLRLTYAPKFKNIVPIDTVTYPGVPNAEYPMSSY